MRNINIWLLSALITGLSVAAHFNGPTTIHSSNRDWERSVRFHQELQSFKNRPLTTNIVLQLVERCHITHRTAFFLLQFALFFLTGPALYYYLSGLGFSEKYSLAGVLLFLLSMPVFLAHLEPIHTWSDFWVYILAPLSFGLAIRGRLLLSAVFMAVALYEYEIAWLLLPALYLFSKQIHRGHLIKGLFPVALALGLYLVLVISTVGFEPARPTAHLTFNFETFLRGRDSIFSLLVSLGFLWVIGIVQIFRSPVISASFYQTVRLNAVLTVLGFVGATFLFGGARESRHFVVPAIFLIPLTLWYFEMNKGRLHDLIKQAARTKVLKTVWLLLISAISVFVVMTLFPYFEYRRWVDINWAYLSIHLALVMTVMTFEFYKARTKNVSKTKIR